MEILAIVLCVAVIAGIYIGRILLHNHNKTRFIECNKFITYADIDERLTYNLPQYVDNEKKYDYVFGKSDMPLGRAMAFLNFFGRSIYNEEPYFFLCKRPTKDNDFSEYGCIIARTGAYFSTEIVNSDKKKTSDRKDRSISFEGLTQIFNIGSIVFATRYSQAGIVDKLQIINVGDWQIARIIKTIGKRIARDDIGICLLKGNVAEVIDEPKENDSSYNTPSEDNFDVETRVTKDTENTEAVLDVKTSEKGVKAAGVGGIGPKFAAFFGEVKNLMNGSRGHGYAAEYANNTMDRVLGRDVESAAQNLDEHGRQVKHGADRLVNGVEIQTKYYKTASETIGAAFEKKEAIYLRQDGSGKMMQIEVPRDQYQEALEIMQKRIDSGQVPNVSPGESAKNYVRKGFFTYEQSFNVAKSGTIESLGVDAAAGAVCCLQAAGISSVIIFAMAVWRGVSPKDAMKECIHTSLAIMGKGTLIYTLTMQLSRKEIANVFAGKVFTADGVSQGFKGIDNPIYKLSENVAEKVSSSGLAATSFGQKLGLDKTSGRQLIGGTVTIAVVFGPDVVRMLRGRISTKQLFKNSVIGAAGIAGAAAGQALIPIPVVGAMVGGAVAGAASKKVMDYFIEDDAKEMFRILKEEFIDQTMLAGLSQEEFDLVVDKTVGSKRISSRLQDMFQSNDYRNYARNSIIIPAILETTKKRQKITDKAYNQALLEVAMPE